MKTFEQWKEEMLSLASPDLPGVMEEAFRDHGAFMMTAYEAGARAEREKHLYPTRMPCPICGKENDSKYFHCSLDCADEALSRAKDIA